MKHLKIFLSFIVIVLFFLPELGLACTTFNLQGKGFNLVGHNYDWPLGNGLVIVNKRGLSKSAILASKNESNFKGQGVKWT